MKDLKRVSLHTLRLIVAIASMSMFMATLRPILEEQRGISTIGGEGLVAVVIAIAMYELMGIVAQQYVE